MVPIEGTANESNGEEEWHIVDNSRPVPILCGSNEPLIDTTQKMVSRSKRTERLQKKIRNKDKKRVHSEIRSFLDLPSELLLEILKTLRPTDLLSLMRVNKFARDFLETNGNNISNEIINLRYPILNRCFPNPILLRDIDEAIHPALLGSRHQQRLTIHKAPYLHISPSDPLNTCSCISCVFAWNNLNLILDLAHWQRNLDQREPIPMIGRGMRPAWNSTLIESHAGVVNRAIRNPIHRAALLQRHLETTVKIIVRNAAIRKKRGPPETNVHPSKRLYQLSNEDITSETDKFLDRSGPPSFEFPFTRDNYYTLKSYLPNRRWNEHEWMYYAVDLHERDVTWAMFIYEKEQKEICLLRKQQA